VRALVISLVPPEVLAALVAEVRRQDADAEVTVLAAGPVSGVADSCLSWQAIGRKALLAELSRRRFDRALIAHGRDQYTRLALWQALVVALLSRARRVALCEDGVLGADTGSFRAVARALRGALARSLVEAYVLAVGVLLLPVLVGIMVTDVAQAITGGRRPGRRARETHET
jgi:hypothetical protein